MPGFRLSAPFTCIRAVLHATCVYKEQVLRIMLHKHCVHVFYRCTFCHVCHSDLRLVTTVNTSHIIMRPMSPLTRRAVSKRSHSVDQFYAVDWRATVSFYVSPCMASSVAFPRTTLDAPWSSASFAPAVLIILVKMRVTVSHGFGCSGCIREKSAS